VDILFGVAGGAYIPPQPFWEMQEADWDFVVTLNLRGQWLATKAVVPELRRRGGGAVVNVSSGAGLHGARGLSAYSAAKAGLIGLTRTMAQELGPFNIRVNSIAPGLIRVEHPKTVYDEEALVRMREAARQRQSVKRDGQPFDIANAATFLASQDAAFITGQVLAVDGG
jgi:3-oxoacyl-[acyl-carrier protein] reductase